ncbi:uncharacterized protein EDB93DRAFT_1237209 [Suillus bovinus]|uniref:uncharacterized protein n=1 Tax=Suillus bovinus TaxID=48563 RepID=UPI001B873866|nr:uncharacterized protein EDB93DRAFT_1237209 [Suillus bovinus]KAG2159960.1 hypothetical protein EDB93DRAFT_1237209 [Suillus bovinus]
MDPKGCHLVTDEVYAQITPGIKDVKVRLVFTYSNIARNIYRTAALTINENYDRDMDMALDNIVPESLNWKHTDEGPDVSHTKTSLIGATISIPITDGRLNLGTWQGIYLTEFRHAAHSRRIVATVL